MAMRDRSIPTPPRRRIAFSGSGPTRKQINYFDAVIHMQESPLQKWFLVGCSSPFMRLAQQLTAHRAWCKQCLPCVGGNPTCSVPAYSTGHLIRNRKAGPGWFSYPRMGAFYTNFSITTLLLHNLLFFRKSQPAFLLARFLIYYRYQVVIVRCPVLYTEAWRTVSTEKIVVINKWRLPYLTWYTRIYYKRYTRYWYFVPGTWYLVLVISLFIDVDTCITCMFQLDIVG